MFDVEIVVDAADPAPRLHGGRIEREGELHVVEMGLVELGVLIPIHRKGVPLDAGKKIGRFADRHEQLNKGARFVEEELARLRSMPRVHVGVPNRNEISPRVKRVKIPIGEGRVVGLFLSD